MQCPRCQQDNPVADAQFCPRCGASVSESESIAKPYGALKNENEVLRRSLSEANEQQTATAEILRVISQSPTDVQPVFDTIMRSAVRLCDGVFGGVFRVDDDMLHMVADYNYTLKARAVYAQVFPLALTQDNRRNVSARAVIDRTIVHLADIRQEPDFGVSRHLSETLKFRAILSVPMVRDGRVIGTITVARAQAGFFSENQVELLKTFADQAVIAIENVRLFTELQDKNQALTQAHAQVSEALEQQTATSEILKVIASSPTDTQPVFDAIAENAARLCSVEDVFIVLVAGDALRAIAATGQLTRLSPDYNARRVPVSRTSVAGRVIVDRATMHIDDLAAVPEDELPDGRALQRMFNHRTILATPLLREGAALGAIVVFRLEVRPFSKRQQDLLQTFANQAVIAIENVRLFKELQTRNSELSEALEQQTATSEILQVISSSPTDIQPVLDAVAANAARLCDASDAQILRADGDMITLVASYGSLPTVSSAPRPISRRLVGGRAIIDGVTLHIPDVTVARDEFPDSATVPLGMRTVLATPLLREGVAIGVIMIRRMEVRPFSEKQVQLLKTFADQAVIAIENVRLFTELQEKNRALTEAHAQVTEALEQQTATAEILRVIASSPTDLQPVLDAVAERAARLCGANDAGIYIVDGDVRRQVAHFGTVPLTVAAEVRLSPGSVTGRAILERRTIHIQDIFEEFARGEYADSRQSRRELTLRTLLVTPLLREGVAMGAIAIRRTEVRPFSDKQVELLKIFADQAVIAIENVRLFKELQARTVALTRSVGQLTALGDVGRAVSSTLDLDTVLTTIVSRAVQLAEMDAGAIYEYDQAAEVFRLRATQNLPEEFLGIARPMAIRKGEGATGRLAVTREPVQIPDITPPDAYQSRLRDVLLRLGHRAVLAVPLLAEDRIVGSLIVTRARPGDFPPEMIDLLKTFATQSALAIQNARLFREIEDKSRQLEVASQHKSEFLANMSHELRTPLNAIIGFSEVLTDRMFGELNEKQEEYLTDIYASGTHLLSLINDILDLSKIEAGRMELELTDFHLPTALENALMLIRERAGRRNIALHTTIDDRLGEMRGDERKIRQVVLNLLSNAIKFTPEGGRINVSAVPKDGLVEVSVSDTGVGIAPEDQGKVFEEFRQVGTADKKAEGTGLGLTLCRKFIKLHGGQIWVKSQVGAGSTFTFTLPLRPAE